MEQGLYRVAQEALENVVKHAQARRVSVRLAREGGRLTLSISDDGCGFEAAHADSDQHYGLRGMFERAGIMGGKLQVESQPGQGTTIHLTVEEGRGPRAHL
jgi:signal transduction histidine kinase